MVRLFISCLPILFLWGGCLNLDAQSLPSTDTGDTLALPKVFLIGEYEEQYGLLYETYHDILLSVCHDDMNLAFSKWMDMLSQMETYAQQINFELRGVKVWLKVFWDSDGHIDHISYYLKPNSRNIDPAELSAFLSSFMNHYQLPVNTNVRFTHNGSAAFPTAMIPALSKINKE